MKRASFLLFLLLCAPALWAAPAPSMRLIGGVDVGYVPSDGLSVSPDGRYLAVLSLPGEKGSNCAVIERATHKSWMLPGSSRMEPLTFARDGHALWVWGLHGDEPLPGAPNVKRGAAFIALYDPATKRYRFALKGDVEDWDVPGESTLSRDGRTLIYASQDGWVRGFSTRTGRQKWKKRAINKGNVPVNVALSPDGTRALRFPDDEGKFQTTQIISTRNGRVLQTLRLPLRAGMMSAFEGGRFAPRGNKVAVFKPDDQSWNFFDGRSGRWKWKMGKPSTTSEGSLSWVWSPDAQKIAVSGPQGFELRDANSGHILSADANRSPNSALFFFPDALQFSPDGKLIYALAANDTGFGAETVLWQLRVDGTRAQRRADKFWLDKTRAAQAKFALSPRHINQSLILAARGGDPERVAFLLDRGANIETRDNRGETALVNAGNATAVVQLLLERGANFKPYGGRLLANATAEGNDTLTRLFLKRGVKVDADAASYGTSTALLAAIRFGKISTVRLLLDAGADVNARNENGETALLALASSNSTHGNDVPIAQMLLDKGADIRARTALNAGVGNGEMALNRATRWANVEYTKVELIKFLIERGADPNGTNAVGETPLILVAADDEAMGDRDDDAEGLKQRLKLAAVLLARGADPDAHDRAGNSARSVAVSPALKKLLDARK